MTCSASHDSARTARSDRVERRDAPGWQARSTSKRKLAPSSPWTDRTTKAFGLCTLRTPGRHPRARRRSVRRGRLGRCNAPQTSRSLRTARYTRTCSPSPRWPRNARTAPRARRHDSHYAGRGLTMTGAETADSPELRTPKRQRALVLSLRRPCLRRGLLRQAGGRRSGRARERVRGDSRRASPRVPEGSRARADRRGGGPLATGAVNDPHNAA